MSNLPGNPHAHEAEYGMSCTVLSAESAGTQNLESLLMDNAQATLALAFEQRTANLLAYVQAADGHHMATIINEAFDRLGLGEIVK